MNVNRKTKPKRLLSMLLVLMMVLTLLPTTAFAAEPTTVADLGSGESLYDLNYYEKYSLQGTTQGNGLTGGVLPVRFSM